MKIGVLAFVASYTADPAAVAKKCEALGFESFYLPEHPILPVKHKTRYPLSPDGEIPELYAQIAQRTGVQIVSRLASTPSISASGCGCIGVPATPRRSPS